MFAPFYAISKQIVVRPDPREPWLIFVGLAVDQNHVRFDVAVAEAFVGSCQGVIAIFDWEGFVDDQQFAEIGVIRMCAEFL